MNRIIPTVAVVISAVVLIILGSFFIPSFPTGLIKATFVFLTLYTQLDAWIALFEDTVGYITFALWELDVQVQKGGQPIIPTLNEHKENLKLILLSVFFAIALYLL